MYEPKPLRIDDFNKAEEKEVRKEKKSALKKENKKEGKLLKTKTFKEKNKRTVKKRRCGKY